MFSLERYSRLLATGDLRPAIVASFLGRLPIGMTGLALVLLIRQSEAAFLDAGIVTAGYLGGLAIASPVLGRLIDRFGPRRLLIVNSVLYPVALLLLLGAQHPDPSLSLSLSLSILAGASFPPITICIRTLYRQRLTDDDLLTTAFSLDSVLVELVFILGPALTAALVALHSPSIAVVCSAAAGSIGALWFAGTEAVRSWTVERRARRSPFDVLRNSALRRLVATGFGCAAVYGLVEIGVPAYATAKGEPALAGVLLGIMSIGSASGGIFYGSRSWRFPLAGQYAGALVLMGAGVAVLALVDAVWLFAGLCIVAGSAMAAPLIIQSIIVTRVVPTAHTAEAFTWTTTAMLCGVGAGMAVGGILSDLFGWRAVFLACAAHAVVLSVAARRVLQTTAPAPV